MPFRLPSPTPSSLLAEQLGRPHLGPERWIEAVAPLDDADDTCLAFSTRGQPSTGAGCLLTHAPVHGHTCLLSPDPLGDFVRLLDAAFPDADDPPEAWPQEAGLGGAWIHPEAAVERGVWVAPGAIIGRGARIGAGSQILPYAVIHPGTEIGPRCRIGAHAVIGADGFGFAGAHPETGLPRRVPHLGRVRLGAGVFVGAGVCVARGMLSDTVLADGVALDNLVQVGHNARVGVGSVAAAQVGIGGSAVVGAGVQLGGQAGVADHREIGDGARVGAQSGVARDVPAKAEVLGTPAMPAALTRRLWGLWARLPEWWEKAGRP